MENKRNRKLNVGLFAHDLVTKYNDDEELTSLQNYS